MCVFFGGFFFWFFCFCCGPGLIVYIHNVCTPVKVVPTRDEFWCPYHVSYEA